MQGSDELPNQGPTLDYLIDTFILKSPEQGWEKIQPYEMSLPNMAYRLISDMAIPRAVQQMVVAKNPHTVELLSIPCSSYRNCRKLTENNLQRHSNTDLKSYLELQRNTENMNPRSDVERRLNLGSHDTSRQFTHLFGREFFEDQAMGNMPEE